MSFQENNSDLLAIKAELTHDPLQLGLTLFPEDDEANSIILNTIRVECIIDREAVAVNEITKAIDRDEFVNLSASDRDWLKMITSSGVVNPKAGSEVREGILQIFGSATESRANLNLLLTEPTSRINQMFKLGLLSQGGDCTPSDIASARTAT